MHPVPERVLEIALDKSVIVGSMFLVSSVTGAAFAQSNNVPCEHLHQHEGLQDGKSMLQEHRLLYEHALIAGVPSRQSSHSCRVTKSEVLSLDLSGFEEIGPSIVSILDFPEHPFYYDRDGVSYMACESNVPGYYALIRAVWWRFSNGDNISLIVGLHIMVGVGPELPDEELGFELHRGNRQGSEPEVLLAVRGTDPRVPEQVYTNITAAKGESCAMSFMIDFVQRLSGRLDARVLTVVGHSLGGVATQYIARDGDLNSVSTFNAYSYNASGVSPSRTSSGAGKQRDLLNYHVDGDAVVAELSRRLETRQLGRVLEYAPRYPWWRFGPIERHELETVQSALCECIRGYGSLRVEQ